jgi:hypothetical protein
MPRPLKPRKPALKTGSRDSRLSTPAGVSCKVAPTRSGSVISISDGEDTATASTSTLALSPANALAAPALPPNGPATVRAEKRPRPPSFVDLTVDDSDVEFVPLSKKLALLRCQCSSAGLKFVV